MITIETPRLLLRPWLETDFEPFYQLCSDPDVMQFFPETLDRTASDALANKAKSLIEKNGWGFWACELKEENAFIGFVGLNDPDYELPFSPCTEIGWRFAKSYWRKGYATEAAKASLNFAFNNRHLDEVVSFAVKDNKNSIAVMERIGMINTHQNFLHPKISKDSHLAEHVLFKITREMWEKSICEPAQYR